MKKTILFLLVTATLLSCEGPQGPIGYTGGTGDRGAVGPQGPAGINGKDGKDGINGKDGTTAKIIDVNLDISNFLSGHEISGGLDPLDIVWVYINKGSSYSPLPYRGYATSVDKDFLKLDIYSDIWKFKIYVKNETVVPIGATYNFRIVIVRGTKGGRIKQPTYKELQENYNLPQ